MPARPFPAIVGLSFNTLAVFLFAAVAAAGTILWSQTAEEAARHARARDLLAQRQLGEARLREQITRLQGRLAADTETADHLARALTAGTVALDELLRDLPALTTAWAKVRQDGEGLLAEWQRLRHLSAVEEPPARGRLPETAAEVRMQALLAAVAGGLAARRAQADAWQAVVWIALLGLALLLGTALRRRFDALRRSCDQGGFFKGVSDHAGVGVVAVDGDDRIVFANPLAEQLLVQAGGSLVGRHMHGERGVLARGDGRPLGDGEDGLLPLLRRGETCSGEYYLRRDDRRVAPVCMTAAPWRVNGGVGAVCVFQDISERLERERDLRLADTVFENSHQGIVIADAQGRIIRVNPAFCGMTGFREDELIGVNPRIVQSGLQDETFYREMWSALARNGRWQGEMRNRRKDGRFYTQWTNIDVVRTERGELLYVAIASDISELVDTREQLASLAYFDPLTGLPNRVLFQDRLSQGLAQTRRKGGTLALLCADLDDFKTINDTLGHAAGDHLLLEVAERLRRCVRETDTVARLGGDEFAVILVDANGPREVSILASQIIAALSASYRLLEHDVSSGVSLGIAFAPTDGDSPEELLQYADVAMYRAKAKGRNNFQFFTGDMADSVADSLRIESGLRGAVAAGQMSLHYQTQNAPDGRPLAVEALMRWDSPELGSVSPGRFIPVAEKTGLITGLGDFALREACRQCRQWRDTMAAGLRVSVNLSAVQFRQEDLPERIAACLREYGLPGDSLELEITESVVMEDVARGQEMLTRLKGLGCRIAIDDFGTGYSSLSYLKRFPVDVLKIDMSFIQGLGSEEDDTAVVRAIISLARSLRLEVVAEGVETAVQLDALKGITGREGFLAQGNFFSPPLPAADFEQRIFGFGAPAAAFA